jgi:nucleoside-diphosphate-sugar epimerase
MTRARVAVLGASGLLGVAVVERLSRRSDLALTSFVRSSGNAWRLLQLDSEIAHLDLLDEDRTRRALQDFDFVVNCSRGDGPTMLASTRILVRVGRECRWKRFIHVSSVAVYGDPPPAESRDESAPTEPTPGSYGAVKLQQDRVIQRAARNGLPAVILCPPNITGPFSYFLLQIVDALRSGALALVDDGDSVCCTVDVANLAYAVELALDRGDVTGARYFVSEAEPGTWKRLIDMLLPLVESAPPLRRITREELLEELRAATPTRASVGRSVKHLLSGDVREVLRRDPGLATIDRGLRRIASWLGSGFEQRVRHLVDSQTPHPAGPSIGRGTGSRLTAQQLRGVLHSPQRAQRDLGYHPTYSFDESVAAFVTWYRNSHGMDSPQWSLLRHLN